MSNPESRPYWQDQDADYGAGWGSGARSSRRDESPWNDGGDRFWRDDSRGGRSDSRGSGNRSSGGHSAGGRHGAGVSGGSRWSQAADDLKSRAGALRASAIDATRGMRRRAGGSAAAYPGATGRPDYAGGRTGSRTAVRDHQDDFWGEGEPTGRMTGSRTAVRPDGSRRGLRGGGGGGRGGGGGGLWDRDPRGRGGGFKNWLLYGSWWRHWTWKKLVLVMCAAVAGFVLLAVIGVAVAYSKTPIPTDVSQEATWQSSSVYFKNGQLLGTFTNGQDINRQLLTTSQMPTNVEDAIIAAEDRNFYREGGISVTGIMRAAYDDLFGSGGIQGGSTITEQYAKNYYANIGASRTVTTKLKEIFVSIKLAHSRSKLWILTNYLNTVPFGANIYGVQAAAQDYFGVDLTKSGQKLNPAQAAMLGAMPNNPAVFTPDPTAGIGYTMLVQRWQYVLGNMARDGALTQAEANTLCATCALPAAEKAFNANIHLNESSSGNGWSGTTGYLMQMVQQELTSTYHISQKTIDTGGLRITTTFDPSMMRALTKAVNTEKAQLDAAARAQGAARLPSYDHFGISLEDPRTGGIIAIYGGPGYLSDYKLCQKLYCDYNMAEAPHPVGSSMKPYVLAAAINQGMNVQNSVLNGFSPLWIPPQSTAAYRAMLAVRGNPPGGVTQAKQLGWWESKGDASMGPLSVAKAAAQSSDPAFTDLAHHVGVASIIQAAQQFGVGANPFFLSAKNDLQGLNDLFGPHGSIPGSVQIALGQGDLTPIEQASTFATLIDNGVYHAPHVISHLSEWTPSGQQQVQLKIATHAAMSPASAADEDYALSFDTINGTGYPNATWNGRPVIGKTGTLGNGNAASEAWFVGAIPQYAMAVGLWTNSQAQNLDNLPSIGGIGGSFGGAWPAATWKTLMASKFANLPVKALPTPNYTGYSKWVLVAPQKSKKQACQQGQGGQGGGGCTCGKRGRNCGPNPNPTPTPCQFLPQGCGGGGGPTPTPTPTPTPSCTPQPGTPCPKLGAIATGNVGALTASTSAVSTSAALSLVWTPAEESFITRSAGTRLLLL